MQPISSSITGAVSQVQKAANSIGQQLGETASVMSPEDVSKARNWLIARSPAQVEMALQTWLQSQHGVSVTAITESRFPTDGGFYSVQTGADVHGPLIDQEAAVRRLELAMTPLTKNDAELAMDLYASNLCKYPADIAKAACEKAAKGKGGVAWFPTLAELIHSCETLVAPRRYRLSAVRNWTPPIPRLPVTERTLDADDWRHAAAKADEELYGIPKPDIDRQSELKEFIAACHAKIRELREAA